MSIPNHPGALDAYSRYEHRYRNSDIFRDNKQNLKPTNEAECFFRRATHIYPQHPETFRVWGLHYYRNGQYEKSVDGLMTAMSQGDNSADVHYYAGLSYLALGNDQEAIKHAKVAYDQGFPLQGLKNKLADKLD